MLLAGYACGSIPTGVMVGRYAGVDVRAVGSGNVGATNVARSAGRGAGIITLVVDVAKGALPVWVARWLGESPAVVALVGLAAVAGHLFPIFSRFRGGKGVATAAGVFLVLTPLALTLSCAAFALTIGAARIVSLASIVAVGILPIAAALIGYPTAVLTVAAVVAVAVWIAHRDNIRRLVNGTEPRFSRQP